MSCGPDSTSIVATTFPARGSIRDTEPSTKLDTQTLPNAESANRAESPTSMVSTIRSVAGSIRPTTSSFSQTTHTEPGVSARPSGASQTWIVATTVFVRGSILETDASSEFDTHIDPAAAVVLAELRVHDPDAAERSRDPERAGRGANVTQDP
jgi:hypothetical protein